MGIVMELTKARREIVKLTKEKEILLTEMADLTRQLLKATVPPPPPVTRRTISGNEMYNLLRLAFPEATEIYISDQWFNLCDIEDIELFLDVDETNHYQFVKEDYDCDKFARRLWGQFAIPGWADKAICLVWTDLHALIMCVDANEDIWFLEPQTDERRSDLLEWQGTEIRFIVT